MRVLLYRYGLEHYVGTNGTKRAGFTKAITLTQGSRACLESRNLVVQPLVSQRLLVQLDLAAGCLLAQLDGLTAQGDADGGSDTTVDTEV